MGIEAMSYTGGWKVTPIVHNVSCRRQPRLWKELAVWWPMGLAHLSDQARRYVSSEELLHIEATEAVERLMITLKVSTAHLAISVIASSPNNPGAPSSGVRHLQIDLL